MPFVAPKGATTNSTTGAANRNSFRPPWVKEDGSSPLKPVSKTVPWAKKTAATTDNDNGAKITATAAKKEETNNSKKPVESIVSKKIVEPVKKTVVPAVKKAAEPVIKKPIEPVKKTPISTATKIAPNTKVTKKPTPPSSSSEDEDEEEDDDEEEEETESEEEETEEEESEEEDEESVKEVKKPTTAPPAAAVKKPTPAVTNKTTNNAAAKKPTTIPEEKTSELERRFSLEKPKLRPVVVKRDKSLKKIEDDEEAEEGETEEERARRLRFKLEKPKLRHVKREEKPLPSKSSENILKIRPVLKKVNKIDEIIKEPKEEPKPEFKTKTLRKTPSIKREPSMKNVPAPPPIPSLVPKAPPPPPPINGAKPELNPEKKAALERLKSRPRRRPDWSEMMKEVESGRKLRHVECNDRSAPIVKCKSITKVDDKFIYETEKDNSHNKLLQQIQGGIKLRPTKTNDRSKPVLDGLRKFRRQLTIEEQLQRSQSKINMLGEAPAGSAAAAAMGAGSARASIVSALSIDDLSEDELDDIDKVRDDLQSTKQMLALELRNREAQERENKKLLAQIATLEAELAREKSREKNLEYGSNVIVATMEATPVSEECYLKSLKEEADEARKMAKDLEKKYLQTGELLDQAKSELEEQKRQIQKLERQLAQALQRSSSPEIYLNGYNIFYANDEHYNYKTEAMFHIGEGGSLDGSRRPSDVHGDDSAAELESESDPDEPEEKKQERRERKAGKEVKVLRGKLTKLKVKEEAAKKEKQALKDAMKKNQVQLKEEHKKFKKLEKEVHKMAASMKEENSDEDEDEETEGKEEEVEEEEEEEESEEESEESESESESESASESEAEDASNVDKKNNLEPRVKKHEGRLNAMKKCNVLLQANVDNLQDEISQVRSKAANLQAELDSVLADLGF